MVRRRQGEHKRGRTTEMDVTVQVNLNPTATRAVQKFRVLGLKDPKNENRLLEYTSQFTENYYYYYYQYYYLLQLSFHSVAVILTQVRIYTNETIQKHSTNNAKHSKYKYTYYQNTVNTSTHITKTPQHYKIS